MIEHAQPIVRYGKCLINLTHVMYVRVQKADGYNSWKLTIQFIQDQRLAWTYPTEDEAYAAQEKFEKLTQRFMIEELP